MTPETLFYIIVAIIAINFVIEKILGALNARHFNDPIPEIIADVYDAQLYRKSQRYKMERYRFGLLTSTVSFIAILLFLFFDGFAFVDSLARSVAQHPITITLIFFGIILLASDLLTTPFTYYSTFNIEEKYGFNKTSKRTFWMDKVKGYALGAIIGGALLSIIVWLYLAVGQNFWWFAWIVVTLFSIFMNLFYARFIVPIFNKQTPLAEGSLRSKIESYANGVGFNLENIYVIDGSKRSTKANAYFSGFGKEKRITLYDTLITDLEEEEIVAVLAHEVGHYKKNHIIINLVISVISTGFTLWLLSLFVGNPILAESLNVRVPSFHIGLIAFGLLYAPISEVTGLLMNYLSRKFEYQADRFAKETYRAEPLIRALKELSKNNLVNLTPHRAYVIAHYSHPTLQQRVLRLHRV
ncbi:MAG: peptidase M48 [Flavobacteriaceae bacterium]|nr:peptidase M48 [Flavobacteriaceae bacterium]